MDEDSIALFLQSIEKQSQPDELIWKRVGGVMRQAKKNGTWNPKEHRKLKRAVARFLKHRARRQMALKTAGFSSGRDSIARRPYIAFTPDRKQVEFFSRVEAKYGLTKQQYLRMLVEQGSRCACCEKELVLFSTDKAVHPVVDHCHRTGKVRGLLCPRCNMLVGRVEKANGATLEDAKRFLVNTLERVDRAPDLSKVQGERLRRR